jgi:biopolymer transport protein ExbB
MWAFFVKGGPIMYPLALLSVLGVAVLIEKLVTLRKSKVLTPEIIHSIESLRSPADIPMAIRTCERHQSALAHVVRAGLEAAGSPIADVRLAMEDIGRREVKRLERFLVVLETVAAAGPLLGLLGTVLGIIQVFSVISIAGVGNAGLLSGGISLALITTAFGLFIGIPALIAYNFLDSLVDNLSMQIEGVAHLLLKQLGSMQSGRAEVREFSDAS